MTDSSGFLCQALTYRVGHHSTSDDSTKYRPANEIEYWKMERNPVNKFRNWVENNGWWGDEAEAELRTAVRKEVKRPCTVSVFLRTSQSSMMLSFNAVAASDSECWENREASAGWAVRRCLWHPNNESLRARDGAQRSHQETPGGLPIRCSCLVLSLCHKMLRRRG